MKTYLADIIPKIKRYSQKLDNITLLTNQHWVVINEMSKAKNVYIFRENGELLISQDGRVEKAKWEYLGNDALLIDRKDESYLFRHGFFDENVMALKVDGREEYAFLVNENIFGKKLNSAEDVIEFLNQSYLAPNIINKTKKEADLTYDEQSDYVTPQYEIQKQTNAYMTFGGVYTNSDQTQYSVQFQDGIEGEVNVNKKNGKAFFKARDSQFYCYYENLDYCIHALYHYIKTRNILKKGKIDP